jgi:hypothetical protein
MVSSLLCADLSGKLFIDRSENMKKIVFYCGVEGDQSDCAYVRNGREYIAMTDVERLAALSGIIALLTQELEFVASRISAPCISVDCQSPVQ